MSQLFPLVFSFIGIFLSLAKFSSKRNCTYIKYFTVDDDRDGIPQTDAILLTMRRSTWFPLSSLVILLIAGTICFVGHCESGRKNLTFVSGILFVLAGLCTLVGIILYIGSITEEVGNKPKVSLDDVQFLYNYGSSFMMAVGSFALTEMSGVFSVYLYITRYKHAQRKKHQQALKTEANDRNQHWRHKRSRPQTRDRSQSRERSRDTSLSRSESYYTYTPISETTCASHELSNYSFPNDNSRNALSTTTVAETHVPRENVYGTAKESLYGTAKENVYGTAKESLYGTAKENVYGTAKESLYGTAKENVYGTAKESLYGTAKENVYGTAKESLYGTAKESLYGSSIDYLRKTTPV
ncbi:hypothetical protein ACF0H5_000212 [Mactra antiquata]